MRSVNSTAIRFTGYAKSWSGLYYVTFSINGKRYEYGVDAFVKDRVEMIARRSQGKALAYAKKYCKNWEKL